MTLRRQVSAVPLVDVPLFQFIRQRVDCGRDVLPQCKLCNRSLLVVDGAVNMQRQVPAGEGEVPLLQFIDRAWFSSM